MPLQQPGRSGSPPFQKIIRVPSPPIVKVPEPMVEPESESLHNGRLASHDTANDPTENLEYRLDTARTLDIFSMQPKVGFDYQVHVHV